MADRQTIIDAGGGDGGATSIVITAIIVALLVAGGFVVFNSSGDRSSVTLDVPKVTAPGDVGQQLTIFE